MTNKNKSFLLYSVVFITSQCLIVAGTIGNFHYYYESLCFCNLFQLRKRSFLSQRKNKYCALRRHVLVSMEIYKTTKHTISHFTTSVESSSSFFVQLSSVCKFLGSLRGSLNDRL